MTLELPRRGPDLNMLPHIVEIELIPATDEYDADKDYTVVHPDECPVACDWSPWYTDYWNGRYASSDVVGYMREIEDRDPGHRTCFVEHEITMIGLNGLDIALPGDAHIDPDWTPTSQFESDWYKLRPGRYVIEAWFTPAYWAGTEIESEAGLTLVGVLP